MSELKPAAPVIQRLRRISPVWIIPIVAALLVERASAGGRPGPFVVGVTGSVAVGKSTVAAVLGRLLEGEFPGKVEAVTTDSFLLPNAELEARGILARKGFPESYDRGLQLRTLSALRDGVPGWGRCGSGG